MDCAIVPESKPACGQRLGGALAEQKHFRELDAAEFAKKAAHFLAEINAIHPFREGNGRVQLSFLTLLAEQAGHPLALERLDPQAILAATVASFDGDEAPLANGIQDLIS